MTTTPLSQPPLPDQVNKDTTLLSDSGREHFLKGCEELDNEEINKKICKQILNAIALDMRRMMDKHLKKMKEMHRDLMRQD